MLQGVMRLITSCGMRVFLVETRENSLFGVKKVGNENKNENERMEQDKDFCFKCLLGMIKDIEERKICLFHLFYKRRRKKKNFYTKLLLFNIGFDIIN